MWVKVITQVVGGYVGTVSNKPVCSDSPKKGTLLIVKHEEILDSWFKGDTVEDHCHCQRLTGEQKRGE